MEPLVKHVFLYTFYILFNNVTTLRIWMTFFFFKINNCCKVKFSANNIQRKNKKRIKDNNIIIYNNLSF